jgi:hypothetical protein
MYIFVSTDHTMFVLLLATQYIVLFSKPLHDPTTDMINAIKVNYLKTEIL